MDLNADLGEHADTSLDAQILPYLSSCSIACGGHAGNPNTVREVMLLAKKQQVKCGAHPSFPDQENFGRKALALSDEALKDTLRNQILLCLEVAQALDMPLHHVKPHGALYNLAAKEEKTALLIGEVVRQIDPALKWMGQAHSVSEKVAEQLQIPFIAEAFADRKYTPDGLLVDRSHPEAVITEEKAVMEQVEELALRKRVRASGWVTVQAQSLCMHGDHPDAINLTQKIHHRLVSKGVRICSV